MLVMATYEFFTADRTVRGDEIQFKTDNNRTAVRDFVRWWANRHKAVPEQFSKILAVKIYEVTPQKVGDDGYLDSSHGFNFYEWKCDWGIPFGHLRNGQAA